MNISLRRVGRLCAVIAALAAVPGQAGAQSPASTSNEQRLQEARTRYERGLKLFDDNAYDAARSEFERAYELAPSYRILYNIGLVRARQLDFVGAIQKFEQYLRDGKNEVSEERRKQVLEEMEKLRGRVGTLNIVTNVGEVDVLIDDKPAGKSTMPIQVNSGERRVTANKPGFMTVTKVIDVAGSDRTNVHMTMVEVPTRTIIIGESSRRVPWVGWAATGVLAAGAGVFGYLAANKSSSLDDAKDVPNQSHTRLEDEWTQMRTYSVTSDVLAIGAVVAGGVSLYYTIKWAGEGKGANDPPAAKLGVGPTGAQLQVSF
jgi:hypothetical protein